MRMPRRAPVYLLIALPFGALFVAAAGCGSSSSSDSGGLPGGKATLDQVNRGRYLVTSLACADCHNRGKVDPSDPNWLAGYIGQAGGTGPGAFQLGPGLASYAANITPDPTTGIGSVPDQKIFNELRYGLDPKAPSSPDAVITSTVPGQGNFPANPVYLSPPMPWPAYRHLTDADIWAIVAYVKHGIKPVVNTPPESSKLPAQAFSDAAIGPATFPSYPASNEQFSP